MDRTYSSSAMLLCQLCNVVHFPCRPTHQSFKKLDGHLLASQFLKILGKLTCAKKKVIMEANKSRLYSSAPSRFLELRKK